MKYEINLIDDLRKEEARFARLSEFQTYGAVFLLGILLLVLFKVTLVVFSMQDARINAEAKLALLTQEYQQYQATTLSIDKDDIELLDRLQHSREFWTKKLSSLASPLPADYWVNSIAYKGNVLTVRGFGYLEREQKQLITLDDYLNVLRHDPIVIKNTPMVILKEARRNDGEDESGRRERVSFEFTALAMNPTGTAR